MKSITITVFALTAAVALGQAPPSADKKQLDALRTQYASAKSFYKKSPSKTSKMKLVIATDQLATATMTSEVLDARVRYPEALGLYQQALNLDSTNVEAKNNASMIDSVYKGMIAKARKMVKANPNDKEAAAKLSRYLGIYTKLHRPLP